MAPLHRHRAVRAAPLAADAAVVEPFASRTVPRSAARPGRADRDHSGHRADRDIQDRCGPGALEARGQQRLSYRNASGNRRRVQRHYIFVRNGRGNLRVHVRATRHHAA